MPRIPGVNHLRAVAALEKVGFRIVRQGKHIVMSNGGRFITIPRHNPVNAFTMGGIARALDLASRSFDGFSDQDPLSGRTLRFSPHFAHAGPAISFAEGFMAETETKTKRKPSAAFLKPVHPDEKLAQIIGNQPLARTEVTKKLWDYIRSHNLQDPDNKTFIKADDKLREVFDGKDRVSMFEMTKLVFNHVTKAA